MVLGEALRRNLQEVEEGEFEVIETTPAEGQNPGRLAANCALDGANAQQFEAGGLKSLR